MTEQEYIRRAQALKAKLYRTAALILGSESAAVAHDYVQYIGQSQTVDGVTVELELDRTSVSVYEEPVSVTLF